MFFISGEVQKNIQDVDGSNAISMILANTISHFTENFIPNENDVGLEIVLKTLKKIITKGVFVNFFPTKNVITSGGTIPSLL